MCFPRAYCFDERHDGLLAGKGGLGVLKGRLNSAGNEARGAREARVAVGRAVNPVRILAFRPTPSLSLLSDDERSAVSGARGVVAPLDFDRPSLPDRTRSGGFLRPVKTGVVFDVVSDEGVTTTGGTTGSRGGGEAVCPRGLLGSRTQDERGMRA